MPMTATEFVLNALHPWIERRTEIVIDADRIAAGLPPRNELGLTDHEMAILESRRIKAML